MKLIIQKTIPWPRIGCLNMVEDQSSAMERKSTIKSFWQDIALLKSNRWTGEAFIKFELDLLRSLNRNPDSILDLGSGHGELSKTYASGKAQLTAVDFEITFNNSFSAPNERFILCDVLDFETSETWDVVLLMGVALYLTDEESSRLYQKISAMFTKAGVAIIKHQVRLGEGKIFNGYSQELGSQYWGRYPSLDREHKMLRDVFPIVHQVPYPDEFNRWPDTRHMAFVCRHA